MEPRTPEQKAGRAASKHRMYQRRKEAGLCVRCGKARDAKAQKADWVDCSSCRENQRKAHDASARRARQKTWRGMGTDGAPMPIGRRVPPTGAVKQITVALDREAWDALHAILQRDAAIQGHGPYRVARLVREAIRRWEARPCPPRKKRLLLMLGVRIRVWLDPRQLGVVVGQAERHGGSVSEVIRAMIVANQPHPVASVGGRREVMRVLSQL